VPSASCLVPALTGPKWVGYLEEFRVRIAIGDTTRKIFILRCIVQVMTDLFRHSGKQIMAADHARIFKLGNSPCPRTIVE
jgi:hypothetical protein